MLVLKVCLEKRFDETKLTAYHANALPTEAAFGNNYNLRELI